MYGRWTAEDDEFVQRNEGMGSVALAQVLNRTPAAIKTRLRKLRRRAATENLLSQLDILEDAGQRRCDALAALMSASAEPRNTDA